MAVLDEVPQLHFGLVVEEVGIWTIVLEVVSGSGGIESKDVERTVGALGHDILVKENTANVDWLVHHPWKEFRFNLGKQAPQLI